MNPSEERGRQTLDVSHIPSGRFRPYGTIRCSNLPYFRTQLARDLGCLLDVDDDIVAWCCRPHGMDEILRDIDRADSLPDFSATYRDGRDVYFHVVEGGGDPEITEAAASNRIRHRFVSASEIRSGHRLQNSKDLLRYARYRAPLGDRIRILAALEQEGSASVAECMGLFSEINPMAGLSSLILHRFVTVDLDAEPIAPHTEVRIFRN